MNTIIAETYLSNHDSSFIREVRITVVNNNGVFEVGETRLGTGNTVLGEGTTPVKENDNLYCAWRTALSLVGFWAIQGYNAYYTNMTLADMAAVKLS